MFGQAMGCDYCGRTEILNPADAILLDDLTVPPGWVRVYAHRPRRYTWDDTQSTIEQAYDCCTISCARMVLNEHSENIDEQLGSLADIPQ